jgi:choline dehydrogenase-like flavoprotein
VGTSSRRLPREADVVVVGSGPCGCSAARAVVDSAPGTRVLVLDAGPEVGAPGLNLLNLSPADRDRAYASLAGVPSRSPPGGARRGTRLLDAGGDLPSAKYACNVGGMAAHWTCVVPRPAGCERTTLVAPALLDAALNQAEAFLAVRANPFPPAPVVAEVRSVLTRAFPGLRRRVQPLPMAVTPAASGSAQLVWSGVDTILAPVAARGVEILAQTVATRLCVHRDEVNAVEVFDLERRQSGTVRADAVMVAADAFHTPQLLWASGIKPHALGRYLNIHHQATATVRLGSAQGGRFSPDDRDDIVGALWVPFDEVRHPFHGQALLLQSRGQQRGVHLAWYAPQEPNCDNRVRFDGNGLDGFALPQPRIDFRHNDTRQRLRMEARARVEHAASALGDYMEGGAPRLLPPGSAIHYQGTVRMGACDDGTSVCDRTGRVWGLGNLYLAGNGVIDRATAVNPTLTSAALAILSGQAVAGRFNPARPPVA